MLLTREYRLGVILLISLSPILGRSLPPSPKVPLPTRPLEWNDVNFLATSDSHGWLLGHQHDTWPEPNYSGDFGDFASFVTHMRDMANSKGVDLLLVDAGDHHDGPGLVSTSVEGSQEAEKIFAKVNYDILAIGNHEMYGYDTARWIYENQEIWGGKLVTSNAYINIKDPMGRIVQKPIAEKYLKFKTKQGKRVTAFGVIFDFQAHAANLSVIPPKELVQEPWFLETIQDEPDLFVLVGHMPARGETADWLPVFEAIRRVHPHVPIYIFGGHTHVRDCIQYDDRSIAIVPGRYMETVAFVSSSIPEKDDKKPARVSRRYLDANRVSYTWHTNNTEDSFDTGIGKNITQDLLHLASQLNVSRPLGIAPDDYFLGRYPYGHPNSVLTEWAEKVLPATIQDPERKGPKVIIGNAGSLRADLFKGHFDRNDELTISPFPTAFVYTRLPAFFARRILPEMNRAGASKLLPDPSSFTGNDDPEFLKMRQRVLDERVETEFRQWRKSQWEDHLAELASSPPHASAQKPLSIGKQPLTMGYVTKDACPGKGDDIEHIPVPYSDDQVDFIQTPFPDVKFSEMIDVVVMDFAMDDFLTAVHKLNPFSRLSKDDFQPYAAGKTIKTVWGEYAEKYWQESDDTVDR